MNRRPTKTGYGQVAGVQRKRHLGEGEETYTPAAGSVVFDYAGARFGVAICAESGFDAPFDDAAAAGASLVLFPAAPGLYGRRTSQASWRRGFGWWQTTSLGDASRHARRLASGSRWPGRLVRRLMRTSPASPRS